MMRPDTDRLDAGTFSPTSGPNGVDSEGEQSNPSAETHSKVPPNVWLANKDALQDCESSQNQLEEVVVNESLESSPQWGPVIRPPANSAVSLQLCTAGVSR